MYLGVVVLLSVELAGNLNGNAVGLQLRQSRGLDLNSGSAADAAAPGTVSKKKADGEAGILFEIIEQDRNLN